MRHPRRKWGTERYPAICNIRTLSDVNSGDFDLAQVGDYFFYLLNFEDLETLPPIPNATGSYQSLCNLIKTGIYNLYWLLSGSTSTSTRH